jgi:hypothetical protein
MPDRAAGRRTRVFDPLLPAEAADGIVRMCERVGRYRMNGIERTRTDIGAGMPERYECFRQYARAGGRADHGPPDDSHADWPTFERALTFQFRETYARGSRIDAPGVEALLGHERAIAETKALFDSAFVEPAYAYANIYVPGQALGVHTDITEFRGASRRDTPQWLLICMHHSGLFDRWYLKVATVVSFFSTCRGGAFRYYPDGPEAPGVDLPTRFNTGILLDADSIFHEVRRVGDADTVAPLRRGQELAYAGNDTWHLRDADGTVVASYPRGALRFTISWKMFCFRDMAERDAWHADGDRLTHDTIVRILTDDLVARGILAGPATDTVTFARAVVDTYYHSPPVDSGGTAPR